MKRQIRYTLFAAVAMLLAACAKTDEPHTSEMQLSFRIVDAGYAPTTPTRAAENGFATQFTADDQCGLYIVSGGKVVAANVKVIASGTPDQLVWNPEFPNGNHYHTPGDQYFVYYPWVQSPHGLPHIGEQVTAEDDAEFFAEMIAAWTPNADQSDYSAGYTASDLMTASATIGDRTTGIVHFSFQMTHRMALAVVEMPAKTSNNANVESVTAAFSGDADPCRIQGVYRYLVNPAATPPTLNGSYDNGMKEFSITPTGIAGGSYKTYKVDGGIPEIPKVGDFFYSDGSWSTKLDPNKTVIGIVFQTDPKRIGQAEKDALAEKGVTAPHGLVMAIKNAATSVSWGPTGLESLTNCESPDQNNNDNSGYHNCAIIRGDNGGLHNYPAFNAADEYNTTCSAPAKTTGWFLPASGQWYDLLRNLGSIEDWEASNMGIPAGDHKWSDQGDVCDALNQWMTGVDEADLFDATINDFWSSSQFSNECARYWSFSSDGIVGCFWNSKGLEYAVRAILAF